MTIAILIITAVLLIGYGTWAAVTKKQATISSIITKYSFKYPIIPFVMGVLIGHWLWK